MYNTWWEPWYSLARFDACLQVSQLWLFRFRKGETFPFGYLKNNINELNLNSNCNVMTITAKSNTFFIFYLFDFDLSIFCTKHNNLINIFLKITFYQFVSFHLLIYFISFHLCLFLLLLFSLYLFRHTVQIHTYMVQIFIYLVKNRFILSLLWKIHRLQFPYCLSQSI